MVSASLPPALQYFVWGLIGVHVLAVVSALCSEISFSLNHLVFQQHFVWYEHLVYHIYFCFFGNALAARLWFPVICPSASFSAIPTSYICWLQLFFGRNAYACLLTWLVITSYSLTNTPLLDVLGICFGDGLPKRSSHKKAEEAEKTKVCFDFLAVKIPILHTVQRLSFLLFSLPFFTHLRVRARTRKYTNICCL